MSQRHTASGRQIASGRNQAGARQAKSADREAIDTAEFGALRRVDWDHFEQYSHPQYFQNDVLHTDSGQTTLVTSTGDPVGSGANPWTGSQLSKQTTDADRPTYLGRDTGIGGGGSLVASGWSKSPTTAQTVFLVFRHDDTNDDVDSFFTIDSPEVTGNSLLLRTRTNGSVQWAFRDDNDNSSGANYIRDGDNNAVREFGSFSVVTITLKHDGTDLNGRARYNTEPSTHNEFTIASSPGSTQDSITILDTPLVDMQCVAIVDEVFPTAMETTIIQNLLAVL